MGKTTKIDYADATWSPWIGCDKLDAKGVLREGCRHCYAEAWARRAGRGSPFAGHWGRDAPRYFFGSKHWHQPIAWNANAEHDGVRRRVLVSLCDPFGLSATTTIVRNLGRPPASAGLMPRLGDRDVLITQDTRQLMSDARLRLWDLIHKTPWLDWLLLTKRPENLQAMGMKVDNLNASRVAFPSNVWLGVSCWDQASADRNIRLLLETRAAVHWVSFEPLLGPVKVPRLGLAVVGCESQGPRPGRHCDPAWAESIVRQCAAADVPCFVKQLVLPTWPGRLVKSDELSCYDVPGQAYKWPKQLPEARP